MTKRVNNPEVALLVENITIIIPASLNGPPVVREVILDRGRPHLALVKLENKLQNLRKHNKKKLIKNLASKLFSDSTCLCQLFHQSLVAVELLRYVKAEI